MSHEGNVYVFRHAALRELDMAANRWRELPAPVVPDSQCRTSAGPAVGGALVSGVILVWTGDCATSHGFAFDIRRNEWRSLGESSVEVSPFAVASADSVFTASAPYQQDGSGQVSKLMRYVIADNRWLEIRLPPSAQGFYPFVTVTGDELIVWGGSEQNGTRRVTGAAYAL
jgi:hypothetical protein